MDGNANFAGGGPHLAVSGNNPGGAGAHHGGQGGLARPRRRRRRVAAWRHPGRLLRSNAGDWTNQRTKRLIRNTGLPKKLKIVIETKHCAIPLVTSTFQRLRRMTG